MLTRRSFTAAAGAAALGACQNAADTPNSASGWREGPRAPYAMQEIYPALYHSAIWVAGGFAPLGAMGATRRVVVFDLAQDAWREGPPLPEPAHHVHLAVLGDDLYAIGGYLAGDNRMRWICTPRVLKLTGDAWIEAPSLPKPIGEAVPIAHQGRIHLIGGRSPTGAANAAWNDQGDVDDHFVFDGAAWARAPALPLARNSAAGLSDGERLHVISGRTVAGGQTGAHHIFDPRSGGWEDGPAFPEPRGGLAAAFWRGRIVAGGGEIFEPRSVGDTLYEFADGAWRAFETLPITRHGHGMIAAGDALHLIGGARGVGGEGTLARLDVLR